MRRIVVLAVLAGVVAGCGRGPKVCGRELGEWLVVLRDSDDPAQLVQAADAIAQFGPKGEEAGWELIRMMGDQRSFAQFRRLNDEQARTVYAAFGRAVGAIGPAAARQCLTLLENNRPVSADVVLALSPEARAVFLAGLQSPNARVRAGVATRAADLGPAASASAGDLATLAADPDEAIRLAAVRALPAVQASAAMAGPALRKAVGDSSSAVRHAALSALAKYPAVAGEAQADLRAALADRDAMVREAAALALAAAGPTGGEAIPDLLKKLEDKSEAQRLAAWTALARLGGLGQVPPATLATWLDHADAGVAAQASAALAGLGPRAEPALKPMVTSMREGLGSADLRRPVFAAIGAPAVPYLSQMVKYYGQKRGAGGRRSATEQAVCVEAAAGLGAIGPAARPALGILQKAADEDASPAVVDAARQAIAAIGAAASAPATRPG